MGACPCPSGDRQNASFNLHRLDNIVCLSQKHLSRFYQVGAFSTNDSPLISAAAEDDLHMPSAVYSDISRHALRSLKGERFVIDGDTEDIPQLKASYRHFLEEFSMVLALKDSILCSVHPGGVNHAVIVTLMGDVFPSCDIEGLLTHEGSVRETMIVQDCQDREGKESSWGSSGMQRMLKECQSEDGQLHTSMLIIFTNYLFPVGVREKGMSQLVADFSPKKVFPCV